MAYTSNKFDPEATFDKCGSHNKFNSNYRLILPYFVPYIAFVSIASLFGDWSVEWRYGFKILLVSPLLIWAWRHYVQLTGPKGTFMSVVWGAVFGLAGVVLWILLLQPFVDPDANGFSQTAFFLKLLSATLMVPIFEELLMRGYIFRLAYQWDRQRKVNKKKALDRALHDQCIGHFKPGAWSVAAILISTLAFTFGHQMHEWPASFFYGLLMVLLWIKRKDLISCIVAHGTTNCALGLYVYFTKQWQLW